MLKGNLLIRNGWVVSPAEKMNGIRDVLVGNGRVIASGKKLKADADRIIEAKGLHVCPGFIDMHVHLREPGFEDKETIKTGTEAAVAGGITAVACMPNTRPVIDSESVVQFVQDRARRVKARVYPVGAITQGQEGKALSEIGLMRRAGIVAVSEDGKSVMDAAVMKSALRYCKMDDIVVICHCEEMNLSAGGIVNEGRASGRLGMKGISRVAEDIMVARDIMLARDTGARIHIAHVSTKGSVELIRQAKSIGVQVTAETAPHYLTLTDQLVETFNPVYRVNPPLREQEDINALIKGLRDGTIDAIATDHAPHTVDDKDQEFDLVPNGMIGLETSVGVVLTELFHKRKLPLLRLVELMAVNPAAILKVECGAFREGGLADFTLLDMKKKWTVNSAKFCSKARNTPFEGWTLTGKAVATLVEGRLVYEE
ncbi:MAG: dihydroorotase [Elusimicrobia bacterium RIFOXYB2_FULL_49_7]|nr:MAG: dihydroorotase [Elusimicrobia bacterium RIFOXYB2_FULL_49_7]